MKVWLRGFKGGSFSRLLKTKINISHISLQSRGISGFIALKEHLIGNADKVQFGRLVALDTHICSGVWAVKSMHESRAVPVCGQQRA